MNDTNGCGLRVALLGPYPEEEGKPRNGVESATSALADGMVERGVEAHVVVSVRGRGKPEHFVSSKGVNVHRLPLFDRLGNLTGYAVDVGRIRSALDDISPDIVHIHKVLIYARAALERKWPSVLTIHGIHHLVAAYAGGVTGIRGKLAARYEYEAVRNAKHVVCLNRYTADSYGKLLGAQDVRFIDNPVDEGLFELPGREVPGSILFGGMIYDLKNLLGLLEALDAVRAAHPGCSLRVAGRIGDRRYYDRCVQFIRDRRMESSVEFLGPLPAEQMADELSRAAVVVLPSKQETAPMIVAEAMAAGKPVVATSAGGTAEMIEDGVTGIVVPLDDMSRLAPAISRLLGDDELCAAMGRAGRAAAEQRFRRAVVVDKTLEMYHDIVGQQ